MEEAVKFLWTMLKEALLRLASLGREAVVWLAAYWRRKISSKGGTPQRSPARWRWPGSTRWETRAEKIKQWRLAVENLGAAAWAWFVGRPYLVAAVPVYVMYSFGLCGWFGMVKMMKAPGMGFMIPRIIFQTFPKWYFRIFRWACTFCSWVCTFLPI